jgi:hypothetical protein
MINLNKYAITTALFFFLIIQTLHAKNNSLHYSDPQGVSVYTNGQQSYEMTTGLPDSYTPLRLYKGKNFNYITTMYSGIFRTNKTNSKWVSINSDLFKRRTTLKNINEYRKITAFCSSANKPKKLYLATKHTIFVSYNRGKSWKKLNTPGFNNRNYITALYEKNNRLLIGTSANGIFVSYNHRKFNKISKGLPNEPYSSGLAFYEEVSVIKPGYRSNEYYTGFLFGKGIYHTRNNGRSWKKINIPLKNRDLSATFDISDSHKELITTTSEGIFKYNKTTTLFIFQSTLTPKNT